MHFLYKSAWGTISRHVSGKAHHLSFTGGITDFCFNYPGKLRRLIVNKTTKKAREEILDDGSNEFPVVDQRVHCHGHRDVYYIQAPKDAMWYSKVARIDTRTSAKDSYDFGCGYSLNEPSFAADKVTPVNLAERDKGWLLVPVYELATGVSSLGWCSSLRVSITIYQGAAFISQWLFRWA
jgi:carotenoid cleavage dioxygenase-like enzyme